MSMPEHNLTVYSMYLVGSENICLQYFSSISLSRHFLLVICFTLWTTIKQGHYMKVKANQDTCPRATDKPIQGPWNISNSLMPYPCSPFYADIKSDNRFEVRLWNSFHVKLYHKILIWYQNLWYD